VLSSGSRFVQTSVHSWTAKHPPVKKSIAGWCSNWKLHLARDSLYSAYRLAFASRGPGLVAVAIVQLAGP
jgi:hypothetical protein